MLLLVLCISCGRNLPCIDELTSCSGCGANLIGIIPNCNLGCICEECEVICSKCKYSNRCLSFEKCNKNKGE
jgi:hypothetical protein